jgi:hypothetical protein
VCRSLCWQSALDDGGLALAMSPSRPAGYALAKQLADLVRSLDQSGRAVTSAVPMVRDADEPFLEALDVGGYVCVCVCVCVCVRAHVCVCVCVGGGVTHPIVVCSKHISFGAHLTLVVENLTRVVRARWDVRVSITAGTTTRQTDTSSTTRTTPNDRWSALNHFQRHRSRCIKSKCACVCVRVGQRSL